MAKEEVSNIYGKPRFGLIVGIFAASIVVLLVLGWLFLRYDPLKMKSTNLHKTGMTIVYTAAPARQ
ncbi:MAG: hypothetical protein ACRYF4_06550 [Janthinobacterium lividum]